MTPARTGGVPTDRSCTLVCRTKLPGRPSGVLPSGMYFLSVRTPTAGAAGSSSPAVLSPPVERQAFLLCGECMGPTPRPSLTAHGECPWAAGSFGSNADNLPNWGRPSERRPLSESVSGAVVLSTSVYQGHLVHPGTSYVTCRSGALPGWRDFGWFSADAEPPAPRLGVQPDRADGSPQGNSGPMNPDTPGYKGSMNGGVTRGSTFGSLRRCRSRSVTGCRWRNCCR